MEKRFVIEHPALFLGELREDLIRIYATDGTKRYKIKVKGEEQDDGCCEVLANYPLEYEYEIMEEEI